MSEYAKARARYVRSKFRVKIKSLACEAKIIRQEESRRDGWVRGSLRLHRISEVRNEQRHTLLAYAYVRGVPMCVVEQRCRIMPDALAIDRIVKSLAGERDLDRIRVWMRGVEEAA
jgi:hypothetical protein